MPMTCPGDCPKICCACIIPFLIRVIVSLGADWSTALQLSSQLRAYYFHKHDNPIGVAMEKGCGSDLVINIILTLLGYIPGLIHALYIIVQY